MREDILDQIAQLPGLSRQQLLDMWQKLYRRDVPPGMRRERIVPFLAYRMQEQAYGGLQPSTRSELRRTARSLERSPALLKPVLRPRIKPGTRIFRQWRGEAHEVVVTSLGYAYRGASYASLSEIARQITGTRWSGPAFFGLNGTKSPRSAP